MENYIGPNKPGVYVYTPNSYTGSFKQIVNYNKPSCREDINNEVCDDDTVELLCDDDIAELDRLCEIIMNEDKKMEQHLKEITVLQKKNTMWVKGGEIKKVENDTLNKKMIKSIDISLGFTTFDCDLMDDLFQPLRPNLSWIF